MPPPHDEGPLERPDDALARFAGLASPTTDVLAELVDGAGEGLAVLDEDGRLTYVNPAGAALLGSAPDDLVGRRSPLADVPADDEAEVDDLQVRVTTLPWGDGRVVSFHGHRATRRERQVTAFANTAAAIAREPSLSRVLDALAAEVRAATGMVTCAVVLMDGPGDEVRYVGHSGLPPDYVERFEAARANGALTITAEAYRTRRTVVARGTRDRVLGDDLWAPAHDLVRGKDWDTFVAAPLIVRGRAIGALNGFHPTAQDPDEDDVRFLSVMADHAAIAVDNARMYAGLQLRVADEERAKLARDLHDSVTQALFSLTMQARGIELSVESSTGSDVVSQVRELRELAQSALSEMRALIQFRRPPELRDESLVRALSRLADATVQRTGLSVTVSAPEGELPIEPHLEDDLFRLAQEALNNVVKHARAHRATVTVRPAPERGLALEVVDDGIGSPPPTSSTGFGMASMRERAERHGGRLEVGPGAERGTVVRVVIPHAVPTFEEARPT